jgi:serine/threonine protein kinase
MNVKEWRQIEELLDAALDCGSNERAALIERACNGDKGLRREVESLLAHQATSENFIETPAIAYAPELFERDASDTDDADAASEHWQNRQFGAYKIIWEIGRGGMGAVFLAERSDGEFQQNVALKIIRHGFADVELARRFRQERQILASLNHPNIARLLDGGVSADGEPFLAMEYVEGLRIDEYCAEHNLSIDERLKLFLAVCQGVAYAHQHLVVHRDLKPSNILVTSTGAPKLLDFGIAKLLDAEQGGEHTLTNFRAFTPDYAAPEQVRGERVTTASDVYSLGLLLHDLLHDKGASVIAQVAPGGWLSKRLTGKTVATNLPTNGASRREQQSQTGKRNSVGLELRNIIAMATREEPARRYASVAQFAEDIERYFNGLPVMARKDTFKYRSTKFIERHKMGVASALLVVLAILGGFMVAVWQARVARAERARAERRFNDLRGLANSNLFELHDAIQNLPGSTHARELLTKRALEYLDSLAQESGNDAALQRELVAAYLKVGGVLGNPNNNNLSDTAGAMRSYRKALAIAEHLVATNPKDDKARRFVAVLLEKIADVQAVTGDVTVTIEIAQKSLAGFKALAEAAQGNADARQSLAISYLKVGDISGNPNFINNGNQAAAMQNYRLSADIWESFYASDPTNSKVRRMLGVIYERIGTMQETAGNMDDALDTYRKSQAIRESFAADYPIDTDAVRDAAIAHEKIGNVMAAKGELNEALASRRKSLEIFEKLEKADPLSVNAKQSLAISYYHLGDLLGDPNSPNLGRPAEALKIYQQALQVLESGKSADAVADLKTQETLKLIHQKMDAVRACLDKVCK